MTALLITVSAGLTLVLAFTSILQLLFLESLRLRTREFRSVQFFKASLSEKIAPDTDTGATAFSVVKHTVLAILGVVFLAITAWNSPHVGDGLLPASLLSLGTMLVFSYIIPQLLYRRSEMRWLEALIPAAQLIFLVARPFAWLLNFLYSLADLGSRSAETPEGEPDAAEHIEALISAGEEEGLIEEDDRKLIQSVVAFGDKTAREVMTPRPNIVAIEVNRTLEELRQVAINEQYSRMPVYEHNIDQILGFIHVRDMFQMDQAERKGHKVRDLMRPVRLVPETKPAAVLLREMQADKAHMAIVIDEYGNTAGLVTMEDLVESIVGEIQDEHEPERDFEQDPEGNYVVSGSFDLDRLVDLVDYRADEDTVSTTVGGLISELLGHVPAAGEHAEHDGIRMEVLAANELRVERVRISKIKSAETTAAESVL